MPDLDRVAVGLDVGGTKLAGGLVNHATGKVLARRILPTRPERGGQAVLADTFRLVTDLLQDAYHQSLAVIGIGVGIAELVDTDGNITSDHTIAWRTLPVHATLAKLAPTVIDSDVRAPALAEACFGAGRAYRLFTYVTVGTGISYCLVQDGTPYTGAHGNALVLASMPWTTQCAYCGAMTEQVLEEFASGPALVARYNEKLRVHGRPLAPRGEQVLAAVEAGDQAAYEIVSSAGAALGNAVGLLVNLLDPEAVIVGGGLGLAGGLYWNHFVASTRRHIYADASRQVAILPAQLGVDAGIIGAATRASQEFAGSQAG